MRKTLVVLAVLLVLGSVLPSLSLARPPSRWEPTHLAWFDGCLSSEPQEVSCESWICNANPITYSYWLTITDDFYAGGEEFTGSYLGHVAIFEDTGPRPAWNMWFTFQLDDGRPLQIRAVGELIAAKKKATFTFVPYADSVPVIIEMKGPPAGDTEIARGKPCFTVLGQKLGD